MPLGRDAILSAPDAIIHKVAVPEWGGEVCVKVFDGLARDKVDAFLSTRMKDGKLVDTAGLRALVVSLSLCDESGACLFAQEEIPLLSKRSGVVLDRVFQVASRVNGLSGDVMEQARDDFFAGQKSESGTG